MSEFKEILTEARQDIDDLLAAESKLEGARDLMEAAREFVARVERGEIRSVKTYNAFKAALVKIDGDAA